MRRSLRISLLAILGLLVLAAGWLWWNRPQRADMAAYVPSDTLIYFEANSLPEILTALTSTDAWRTLAPAAGLEADYRSFTRASRFVSWTGVGSAEAVVLARAQVAVTVFGVEAAEEPGLELRIRPRLALVAETHTGKTRALKAVLKLVGDFARKRYNEPKVEESERDEATMITWEPKAAGKKIVAAVADGVVVVANDEAALQSCLAVRRGEKPSLSGDPQLAEMRSRAGAESALGFGYVPRESAPKLAQIVALVLAGQAEADPRAQSGLAILVPQLAGRALRGAAWSSRLTGGQVEDFYLFASPPEITTRLAVALETTPAGAVGAADFLPAGTHQFTRYNFPEPDAAWGGVNAVISSELDPTVAPYAVGMIGKMLDPFGVSSPREFLRTVGPEVTTARLDEDGEQLLMVAAVRDETALRAYLKKQLGPGTRVVRVGGAELLISADPERGASALMSGHVVLGSEENVRKSAEAHESGRTLGAAESFKSAFALVARDKALPFATFTDDQESARRFVSAFARLTDAKPRGADMNVFARALSALPYSVSETRLAGDGLERLTRSPFGQLGFVIQQFASDDAGSCGRGAVFCSASDRLPSGRRLIAGGGRFERVVGEDSAHVDLREERLKVGAEAVQDGRQLRWPARRGDLRDEAFERLPIFVHQVPHAARLEGAQSREERRQRAPLALTFGAAHLFEYAPQLGTQRERRLGLLRHGGE